MIPLNLAHRPVDPRRKLPVPFVHDTGHGTWDFTALIPERVRECILDNLCATCGRPLGWWIAFLGGPVSAHTRVYSDPPMHESCARTGLALCPHINRPNMKRAKDASEYHTHPQALVERPELWCLAITRDYKVMVQGADHGPLFLANTIKRVHAFRNRDDDQPGLIEVDLSQLNTNGGK